MCIRDRYKLELPDLSTYTERQFFRNDTMSPAVTCIILGLNISLRELLLKIRKGFDQYVNVRPVKLLQGAPCPLKDTPREAIDMVFIRENSEGEYAGLGDWQGKGTPEEAVYQTGVFTRKGCERIMRYAYALAEREGLSLIHI